MRSKVMRLISDNRKYMTRQQYLTLRGQVRSGNEEGALRGLITIFGRKHGQQSH